MNDSLNNNNNVNQENLELRNSAIYIVGDGVRLAAGQCWIQKRNPS